MNARDAFLEQATHFDGRSPLYADLARRFATDPVATRLIDEAPGQPKILALLAGLHYLVLRGEATWDDSLGEHEPFLREWLARFDVQTNEVQRCWVLLPLFLHATRGAETVDVVELGSSAGLNLVWDRYRYEYEAGSWGPGDSPITLRGTERGPVPDDLLSFAPPIRSRVGIDRAPVDVTTPEGVDYLKAFVWAGQEDRLARLDAAVDVLCADPPQVVQGDLPDVLPEVLAGLPRDGLTLVFQTAVLGYLSSDERARVRATLERPGRDLVFVSAGSPREVEQAWGMRVFRPGREREFVGHADFHGAWLDYTL